MQAHTLTPGLRLGVVAGLTLALVGLAGPALAHVTANPDEARSPFFTTRFRIGHGCEGSPTTEVRIRIPEGVRSARPEVVAGWEAEVVVGELDEPYEDDGETITEGPVEVAWVGGSLPDANFQEFGLSMRLAEDLAGEVVYFPVLQTCEDGEHRWIEIPASLEEWGELEEPAPFVQVAFGADAGHGGGGEDGEDAQDGEDTAAADAEDGAGQDDTLAAAGDANTAGTDAVGSDALTYTALVVGLLGLVTGGAALVCTGRRGAPPDDQAPNGA